MNEADPIYPGGAFEGDDDSAAVVGEITVSTLSVRFDTEGFTLDFPTQGLQMELSEDRERVLFSHVSFPAWTVYSLDIAILNHRGFHMPWLQRRVEQLKAELSG
jgi:hypothetical protein